MKISPSDKNLYRIGVEFTESASEPIAIVQVRRRARVAYPGRIPRAGWRRTAIPNDSRRDCHGVVERLLE
jgi:hypothetical protein